MKDDNYYYDYYEAAPVSAAKRKNPGYFLIIVIALVCSLLGGIFTYGILSSGGYINKNNTVLAPTATSNSSLDSTSTSTIAPLSTAEKEIQPNVSPPAIDSSNPIVDLVDKVASSVVAVYTINVTTTNGVQKETTTGGGSGFIINQDGIIVTNNHVIDGAQKLQVVLSNSKKYDATVVGTDVNDDIAVLKITPDSTLVCAALGQSAGLKKGEYVVAIGNPLGQEGSVTLGIISAVNRSVVSDGKRFTMIQTDAAINPGNSGGPLYNTKGEVIGINTMKEIQTYDENGNTIPTEGLGYAIPIDIAKPIILKLMAGQKITKPALGITCSTNIDNNGDNAGVIISTVVPNSGAADAGLKVDDIITKFNDTTINAIEDLIDQINNSNIGDKVTLTITRAGKTMTVQVTLKEST